MVSLLLVLVTVSIDWIFGCKSDPFESVYMVSFIRLDSFRISLYLKIVMNGYLPKGG